MANYKFSVFVGSYDIMAIKYIEFSKNHFLIPKILKYEKD